MLLISVFASQQALQKPSSNGPFLQATAFLLGATRFVESGPAVITSFYFTICIALKITLCIIFRVIKGQVDYWSRRFSCRRFSRKNGNFFGTFPASGGGNEEGNLLHSIPYIQSIVKWRNLWGSFCNFFTVKKFAGFLQSPPRQFGVPLFSVSSRSGLVTRILDP
mgnify:CR=1 FL=1